MLQQLGPDFVGESQLCFDPRLFQPFVKGMVKDTATMRDRAAAQRLTVGQLGFKTLQAFPLRNFHRERQDANAIFLNNHTNGVIAFENRQHLRGVDVYYRHFLVALELSGHDPITVNVLLQRKHRALFILADRKTNARQKACKRGLETFKPQPWAPTILANLG